ncbi:hypothetical protein R4282_09795 [Rhodococcus oxybenzonivorans]|nr:hypothetical protein [Rhodococcus oxybenzonivorans]MDV7353297.1 hypothetical protein [Rhodococcus oxybenzonivorans]
MDSSTSIATRLRDSIAVGFIRLSPRLMVGNSTAMPPAWATPRLTASASPLKWKLQLTRSDQELQMPITGRPIEGPPVDTGRRDRGAMQEAGQIVPRELPIAPHSGTPTAEQSAVERRGRRKGLLDM